MQRTAAVRKVDARKAGRSAVRLNLLVPSEVRDRLEAIKEATGTATLTEVVSNALRLHEWLVRQQQQQREVLVRDRDGSLTVVEFMF